MKRAVVIVMCGAMLVGCPKKSEDAADAAPGAAGSTTGADAALATGKREAGADATVSFGGKYTVSTGTMYVPAAKDWASVKFKNDDSKLLGEGDLSLTSDAAGRVSGETTDGPLGAAIFEGRSDGQTMTATIRRKDPKDEGLTGTLVAKIVGDKLEGSMNLAEFNAAVVRVATFTATKK